VVLNDSAIGNMSVCTEKQNARYYSYPGINSIYTICLHQ